MHRFVPRSLPVALAGAVTLSLAVSLPATGAPATATAVSPPPSAAPASAVPLLTGDTVAVPAGPNAQPYLLHPAPGSAFHTYQANGDSYLVPALAQPYLGSQLDPSLFDVSALARDGITNQARIPVTVSFASGSTPSAPAGITLTSVNGASATGYLATSDAASFDTTLRTHIGADVAADRQPGATPLAPGLTSHPQR